ncbi:conserved hypothetical protein [Ricinus communis]|uniref:Uncharacterized protein n=1 Tax=Ricinus communis TaxID=3988 RepID=B9RLV5_RICCO|nr:conserved hypothetical protein [Ricinus communis]
MGSIADFSGTSSEIEQLGLDRRRPCAHAAQANMRQEKQGGVESEAKKGVRHRAHMGVC